MADPTFGRLQAALAAATNEVTVAAANLNFDFCLVKYEAPKEYQPLGSLLSSRRKEDAETGRSHVTARRLAALFEGVCPDTPKLISAYGQRVSEISRLATDKASKDYSSSVFGAYTGVDATSIWAAATSTKDAKGSAIHVHLLACILAIWEPAEAISIWIELVQERRRIIAEDLENGASMPFSLAAAAAQQEITRAELAKWDGSARAWIETASSIMLKSQTQLKLILKNISLPIRSSESVYPSVIEVWRTALTVMERLLSGIPQEVQDGTALIGLSSWHLYPDIHVFGTRTLEIHMEDDLLPPGGILSLGCLPSATTPTNGISWSLSLAHLRYYGHPIRKHALLREDPSRVTASEFSQIVLGCILGLWNVSEEKEMATIVFLRDLCEHVIEDGTTRTGLVKSIFAFQLLLDATRKLIANKEMANRLLALGRKRPNFIPASKKTRGATDDSVTETRSRPYFGLTEPQIFIRYLRTKNARIQYLQRIGGRMDALKSLSPIIRYNFREAQQVDESTDEESTDEESTDGSENKTLISFQADFVSVFPLADQGDQGSITGQPARKHARWISTSDASRTISSSLYPGHPEEITTNDAFHDNTPMSFSRTIPGGLQKYTLLYGDSHLAGIFIPDGSLPAVSHLIHGPLAKVDLEDIHWAIAHGLIDLPNEDQIKGDSVIHTLCVLASGLSVFTALPERIIRIETFLRPLLECSWIQLLTTKNNSGLPRKFESIGPLFLRLADQISIVSYFAGGCDIHPADVAPNSMGISVGDSLYVPNVLLDDPLQALKQPYLVRILGNIGQPNFTIFASVENPITSPIDHSNWRVTNQRAFNGKPEDALGATSMHLSFTSWERVIDLPGEQGKQDSLCRKMESLVSIRERGKWVGDVDMMSALRSPKIYWLPSQVACNHAPGSTPTIPMLSVESWDDLCDVPAGLVVVRAHGNWLARLAAASFLAQQAQGESSSVRRITICPLTICWRCVKPEFGNDVYIY